MTERTWLKPLRTGTAFTERSPTFWNTQRPAFSTRMNKHSATYSPIRQNVCDSKLSSGNLENTGM